MRELRKSNGLGGRLPRRIAEDLQETSMAAVGAIRVENLTVGFGHSTALHDVTASVPAGQLTAIVGPPGSGKTVLLKSLSCELPWGSGMIWIQDVPARLWPSKKQDMCLSKCPAAPDLLCPLAEQVCALNEDSLDNSPSNAMPGLRNALKLLGVEHLEERTSSSLSGRDRSRRELATTLAPLLSTSPAKQSHLAR